MTESLIVELDGKIEKFSSKVDALNKRLDGTTRSSTNAERGVRRFDLSTVAAGVSVGLLTSRIVALSDSFTSAQNMLRNVTSSTEDLANVTDGLFNVAKETRSEFEATATLYARMARATKDLGISQEELLAITSDINKAFKAGGATTQEAAAATVQLSQALASGVLRGDEFNSIAEQAPAILDAVAFATGRSRGELRGLAADGQITADVLIKSLQAYSSTIEQEFNNTIPTFSDRITEAKTNITELISEVGGIETVISAAGKSIVLLSENIDNFAMIAGGGLMLAALTNLSTLNKVLKANPYIAAATGLGALTAAFVEFLDKAGNEKLKESLGGVNEVVTINDLLQKQTEKLQELALEKERIQGLLSGGNVNIDTSEMEEKLQAVQAEIETTVASMAKLQELGKERGLDDVISGGESTQPDSSQEGAGSVALGDSSERIQKAEEELALILEKEAEYTQAMMDAEMQRIEMLAEFALTKEERLLEQYHKELEMLNEYQQAVGASDEELYDRRLEAAEKFRDRMASIKKDEAKDEKEKQKEIQFSMQDGVRVAAQLGQVMFEDNKAVSAALIVADTAAAIMASLKINPYDYGNVAVLAATGAVQLSTALNASKGGGSVSGSAGGGTAITNRPEDFAPETTELDIGATIEGEGREVSRVSLDVDSSDAFIEELAERIARRARG